MCQLLVVELFVFARRRESQKYTGKHNTSLLTWRRPLPFFNKESKLKNTSSLKTPFVNLWKIIQYDFCRIWMIRVVRHSIVFYFCFRQWNSIASRFPRLFVFPQALGEQKQKPPLFIALWFLRRRGESRWEIIAQYTTSMGLLVSNMTRAKSLDSSRLD